MPEPLLGPFPLTLVDLLQVELVMVGLVQLVIVLELELVLRLKYQAAIQLGYLKTLATLMEANKVDYLSPIVLVSLK